MFWNQLPAFPWLHTITSHFYKAHPDITAKFRLRKWLNPVNFWCVNCKKFFDEKENKGPYHFIWDSAGRLENPDENFCEKCATEFKRLRGLHQPENKKTMSKLKTKKKISSAPKPAKKKKIVALPTIQKTSSKSPKTSTPDYYNCLMNYAQQGFYDAQVGKKLKIHACCKKCKLSAPSLNSERDKELVKLVTSYKQVGDSLAKLLKPLQK